MKLMFFSFSLISLSLISNTQSLMAFLALTSLALALANFVKFWNHIFLMLLNLELMGLTFIFLLAVISVLSMMNMELFFIFFTFAVCEASVGIAILIFFSHSKGSEVILALM